MATTDMNAQIHIKDGNGNVNNIFPATKIANVEGLTSALNAKADTTTVTNQLSGKVDKETGKGLSTNDYTTAEKNKLSGIEAQANKTVVDSALSSSSENPVQNKVINTALGNKADASTVSALATTVSGKADASTVSSLSSQVSTNTTNIATQTARIDSIASLPSGSTSGDAELIDGRVGANGKTYTSIGEAIREQISYDNGSNQYYETINDKFVSYVNGVVDDYPNNNLKVCTFPVVEGCLIRYSYTRAGNLDYRGVAFYKADGDFISGVQTGHDVQTFEVPFGAAIMKATVTDFSQIEIKNTLKGIADAIKRVDVASLITVTENGGLDDADNAIVNKIYTIYSSNLVDNLPISNYYGGILWTMYNGSSSAGKSQVFITNENNVYVRISWNNGWQSWQRLSKFNEAISFEGAVDSTTFSDCNNAKLNAIYIIVDDTISNLPIKQPGTLICFSGFENGHANVTGGRVQIYIPSSRSKPYIRVTQFGATFAWRAWFTFNMNDIIASDVSSSPFVSLRNDPGMLACFLKVGCIGDSLSSGTCCYKVGDRVEGREFYEFSWGQYLARMTGNTYYNFSVGGLSAKTFHTTNNTKVRQFDDPDKVCTAYFIGLGQNDYNERNTIGSTSDIDMADYNNNANSYYGNYGKIIQMIKEKQPKAKIFVFTDPNENVENAGYNAAVRTMSTMFDNVYLLDMYTYGHGLYRDGDSFIYKQNRYGHFNAIGYHAMALLIATYVDWIIKTNPEEFREIEFIGTDYHYYD